MKIKKKKKIKTPPQKPVKPLNEYFLGNSTT
jgi:hypothetical protein